MPIKASVGVEMPDEPFLGVLKHGGTVEAFPRGSTILLVLDPKRPDGIVPMIIDKVGIKKWLFKCGCGQKECRRYFVLKLGQAGHHPNQRVVAGSVPKI